MAYEPRYERFTAAGPDGRDSVVAFRKAGVLSVGDAPEVYFFDVDGKEVVVAISGEALRQWQRAHRYLSREEKVDIAGLTLRNAIASGVPLQGEALFLRGDALAARIAELKLEVRVR